MKRFRIALGLIVALMLIATCVVEARADQANAKSVTITIDRMTMGQSIFHPGRRFTSPQTLTVHNFAIRNYSGVPVDSLTMQTCSGRTNIPLNTIQEVRLSRWICRRTDDIFLVENVVEAKIGLTDGTRRAGLINADFGTIEGRTELGEFFLGDPLTVRLLQFNR